MEEKNRESVSPVEEQERQLPTWFLGRYFFELDVVAGKLWDQEMEFHTIDKMVNVLQQVKQDGGRVFVLGVGGSAANAGHLVNDLRKLCGIDAHAPTDNVAELTARINDDGWQWTFTDYLAVSRLGYLDAVVVLSVGGGGVTTSVNITRAVEYAERLGAAVMGIVGPKGGATAGVSPELTVRVPVEDEGLVTALTEAFQAVVWHAVVNHPMIATTSRHGTIGAGKTVGRVGNLFHRSERLWVCFVRVAAS
jgi:D-sedoheptulose 7-phosphate isomerase